MSKMKERGMIFNDAMVRAILEGRKTQTRRPVKNVRADNCLVIRKPTKKRNGVYTHVMDAPEHGLCPFGNVGDRIWVRETFNAFGWITMSFRKSKMVSLWLLNCVITRLITQIVASQLRAGPRRFTCHVGPAAFCWK
ncbi:putative morphogenetic protein [Escherichia coli]|uniref:Putative morphogenetic protein n=1 Tax=Escherichia coli TaxID=562 RepID=A0A2X1LDR2_ECOLX|nr:putative morphogenetic protein [Escherichia coli]